MTKSKQAALAVVILLIAATTSATAASAPKPGTKCNKAGLTQTVAGKKYTCTKSGTKLAWNKGVVVTSKATPTGAPSAEPIVEKVEASPSPTIALVKYKNCTELKAAGAAPLSKAATPDLYELNSGLDRDKDGIACEN